MGASLGAVHKLRHAEGGGGGGGGGGGAGVSVSMTMYTLSRHQYGIMCDEWRGGGVHNGQTACRKVERGEGGRIFFKDAA